LKATKETKLKFSLSQVGNYSKITLAVDGSTILSHTINSHLVNNSDLQRKFSFLAYVYVWKFLKQIKISVGYPPCMCWSVLRMCSCCRPLSEDVMTPHSLIAQLEQPTPCLPL